jgi:hypothetical protein
LLKLGITTHTTIRKLEDTALKGEDLVTAFHILEFYLLKELGFKEDEFVFLVPLIL